MKEESGIAKGSWSRAQACVALLFLVIIVILNSKVKTEQEFAYLAQSFLRGNLHFTGSALSNLSDMTLHNGKYYWPLGPFPAIVLMPFEYVAGLCGSFFYQGNLQPLLVCALLVIIYRIAQRIGYRSGDSAYLACGFSLATVFLGVCLLPCSWYFAQVLTCLLIFAAIAEMTGRRRPLVLGTLFALALATRVTAAAGVVWCIGETLSARAPWQEKLRSLVAIGFPCLIVLVSLLFYNYARFGTPFDQGYAQQIIPQAGEAARALGLFSIRHLPGNLYYLLLASPVPVTGSKDSMVLAFPFIAANPWGMGIFVTSPCFLYLFGLKYRDATSRWLLLSVLAIALPILFYYGIGYRQFGYRYSLDFLPFLYYLLMRNYHQQRTELTAGFKLVLLVSAMSNLYLLAGYTLWGDSFPFAR